jgi:hypothetical protein
MIKKPTIAWPFVYHLSHQPLVMISAFEPIGCLAAISGPKAENGPNMK